MVHARPIILRSMFVLLGGVALGLAGGYLGSCAGSKAHRYPPNLAILECDSSAGSAPATRSAGGDEAIARRCEAVAERVRQRLSAGAARPVVRPPFVVAGVPGDDGETLENWADGVILAAAEAMWAQYFDARPTDPIVVLLFPDERTYRAEAERLFGDRDVSYFGYYRPAQRTLVMNIATGGGTLCHELTHALVIYDWNDIPLWLNEGLASLHEQCSIRDGRITGQVNWRLPALQRAIARDELRPLTEMMTTPDFYGRRKGINYAQARYFCLYLQHRGLMERFYRTCREQLPQGRSPVEIAEQLCGQGVDQIEQDYRRFVMDLTWQRD